MNTKNVAFVVLGTIALVAIAVFASLAMRGSYEDEVVLQTGTTSTTVTTTIPQGTGATPSPNPATTTGQPQSGKAILVARLGESASALNMTVTPLAVVEDSRCRAGTVCVWAGQVKVRVRVTSALGTSEQVIALDGTMTTEAETVKLVAVSERASENEDTASYTFTFEVSRR